MPENKVFDIRERSFKFGVQIVKLVSLLPKTTPGYAIGNQIIRSGTSVGANIEESQNASTRKDFVHGLTIALKEARETDYWLRLIAETKITTEEIGNIQNEIKELIKILTSIIKKTKLNSGGLQS